MSNSGSVVEQNPTYRRINIWDVFILERKSCFEHSSVLKCAFHALPTKFYKDSPLLPNIYSDHQPKDNTLHLMSWETFNEIFPLVYYDCINHLVY